MLAIFRNVWKVPEIRKKLFFIVLMLLVYRIGTTIVLPGINPEAIAPRDDAFMLMMLIGGNPGTIFAMGIQPYITASIIMQLLTVAIPALERLKKEGEEGRKKINQITRISAVGLSLVQGTATVFSLSGGFTAGAGNQFFGAYQNWFVYILAIVCIVTGTMFIMWLAELITEKGIGNGTSFIITANILATLPNGFNRFWNTAFLTDGTLRIVEVSAAGLITVLVIIVLFVIIIAFAVLVQEGERRLPVQYAKKMVGKQLYGGQTSYIPVKVNIAGVMSIIFASSILGMPMLLSGFFPNSPGLIRAAEIFNHSHPIGAPLYVILIFCFTFFYTSFSVNPVEMAENMKKNGGAIPGVRSGKPTADYIQRTVTRLSWIGATFYSVIALIPVLIEWATIFTGGIFNVPPVHVGFGGTTLLIVVGVGLELVKQMESQLLTRHYKGFLS